VGMRRRFSDPVTHTRRWHAIRLQAKRRDGWACVQCGSKLRLEVHHVESVRNRPDLAYSLDNTQTLCSRCHSSKTRVELGFVTDPFRDAWRDAIRALTKTHK
jgi:5-methylcytosine-specific restriction enzyme A